MWLIVIAVFFGSVVGEDQNVLEVHLYRLPQYTYLDIYNPCLSEQNGLYCLGSFRIHPNRNSNETFNFIKEYSEQRYKYDRTLLHRGFCVSSRCPLHPDPKTRFENCVQKWELERNLNTSLESFKYCRSQKKPAVLDSSSQVFLLLIFAILLLNVAGTIGDLKSKDGEMSNLWTCWSIRKNWEQLKEPFENDPDKTSLAPIQVMRVFLMSVVIILHVVCIGAEAYTENPKFFEEWMATPLRILYLKGLSVVQIFFLLSSFLTGYNLLLLSKRQRLGLWMLPKQLLKRLFRIAPLHLLFVAFGATLWPLVSDGPVWSSTIEPESLNCRRKIWTHVFHVNNIIEPNRFCLPQTWSLAADFQLQIVSLVITLSLAQYNLPKLKILATLFILSCGWLAGLAYLNGWKAFFQMVGDINLADSIHIEDLHLMSYYQSPWGSLPACLMGLFMAHVYYHCRQEGHKIYEYKWLRYLCRLSLPLVLVWAFTGWLIYEWKSPLLQAVHFSIERPGFCIFPAIWLFGMISGVRIYPGFKKLSWRIWIILGRLSLSVLMVHWVIIASRFASKSHPVVISWSVIMTEFLVAWCLSFALAVPITLLVEMPMQNTYNYVSKMNFKIHFQHNYIPKKLLLRKEE